MAGRCGRRPKRPISTPTRYERTSPLAEVPPELDTGTVEEGYTRRLFLPDVRGPHRYLRVTWHRESATIVCSHWQDDVCIASTPVSLEDATQLIGLIVGALKEAVARPAGESKPGSRVQPAGLLDRLRDRLRPQLAQVIKLHERLREDRPTSRTKGA